MTSIKNWEEYLFQLVVNAAQQEKSIEQFLADIEAVIFPTDQLPDSS